MGGNRQALVTVTGSGSCLHLGQWLPRRSLCRPVCHFGKNLPTEGWPLKTSEGGAPLVILQLGGVSRPLVGLQGQDRILLHISVAQCPTATQNSQAAVASKHAAAAVPGLGAGAS